MGCVVEHIGKSKRFKPAFNLKVLFRTYKLDIVQDNRYFWLKLISRMY